LRHTRVSLGAVTWNLYFRVINLAHLSKVPKPALFYVPAIGIVSLPNIEEPIPESVEFRIVKHRRLYYIVVHI